MLKIDYKKLNKELYLPKTTPSLIQVPKLNFVAVKGIGNPNEIDGDYQKAMKLLYGIAFTIKMSKKSDDTPDGYHDFVVPPLEGLWDIELDQITNFGISDKSNFHWISMLRLPEFVDQNVYDWAKIKLQNKNPDLNMDKLYYLQFEEGLCAQIMHHGSYDEEMTSINKLTEFIKENGYKEDFDLNRYRYHHEIYLSDPRKCKPDNLKTVIRHPIKKI